ncbi:ABC-type uncharacterized transport system%2C periplasmic component [Bordetella ansorpii]|uniref:ABC-type uncharacterized transport system, periplasmic component n=2 Tax=Bordetella ansorpii TaxID=288768 RepID=A0A157S9T6_9BORD|nr:ABC-type uncharacterized transport system%2C periplasmic component [Bordetella ansorpii]
MALRRRLAMLAAGLGAAVAAPAALGHPHMWIDARATLVFDAQGRMAAIRQFWRFDEMFAAYAAQGLPTEKDGTLSAKTMQAMADDWMQALGEPISHFFTTVEVDGHRQVFGKPREARVTRDAKGLLALSFVLPLAKPAAPGGKGVKVDVFDPTYFVAYAFDEPNAVTLQAAPAGCKQTYRPPRPLDWKTMQELAAIPADADGLPEELLAITKGLTHRIEVACS